MPVANFGLTAYVQKDGTTSDNTVNTAYATSHLAYTNNFPSHSDVCCNTLKYQYLS